MISLSLTRLQGVSRGRAERALQQPEYSPFANQCYLFWAGRTEAEGNSMALRWFGECTRMKTPG